nr:uncharacterized protein LOC110355067 isoform X3 [Columba livia]
MKTAADTRLARVLLVSCSCEEYSALILIYIHFTRIQCSPKWWQTRGCQVEHLLPALLRSRAEGAMGRMRTGPGLVAGGGCRGAELVLLPLLLRLHLRAWDSVYLSKEERKPRWSWCEAERVCTESDEVYRRPEGSGSGGHLCTIFLVPHDTGLCCVKSSPSCHALLVLTTTSPAQVSIPASPPPLRVKIWELWVQRNELRPLICCSSYSRMAPCTVPWQHQLPVPDGTRFSVFFCMDKALALRDRRA